MTSPKPSALIDATLLRVSLRLPAVRTVPNSPRPGSRAMPSVEKPEGGGVAAADMVRVEEGAPAVIVVGLNEQVMPAGATQLRLIGLLNPPTAAAPTMMLAEPPRVTVALWAEKFSVNPGPGAAAAVVMLAKALVALPPGGKLGWLAVPPAVRKSVRGSPVPPAPKTRSHRP